MTWMAWVLLVIAAWFVAGCLFVLLLCRVRDGWRKRPATWTFPGEVET